MTFTLGGEPIEFFRLHFPEYGVHSAEVEIQTAVTLAGAQTLVVGDLTLQGVAAGGVVAGRGRYDWTAGAGRWGEVIEPLGYNASIGVQIANVLLDAAAKCGETMGGALPQGRVGVAPYAGAGRLSGPAWDVFRDLSVPWWLDAAGVTQARPRETGAAPSDATLIRWDRENGIRVLSPASDALAGFLPGRTYEGEVIRTLDIEAREQDAIRITITTRLAPRREDVRGLLDEIVDQRTRQTRYFGRYRYRVVVRSGTLYDLEPIDLALGLPKLAGRSMMPGAAGHDAQLPAKYEVVLSFLDGLESRPFIDAFMRPEAGRSDPPGALPERTSFNASEFVLLGDATQLVARETDPARSGIYEITVPPAGTGPIILIQYTDEAANQTAWQITGSTAPTGGPVTFVVSAVPATAATLNGKIMTPNQSKVKA